MNYLVQIRKNPDAELDRLNWQEVNEIAPEAAAVAALKERFGFWSILGSVCAFVAEDKPRNKHPNGMPIMIHAFQLKW